MAAPLRTGDTYRPYVALAVTSWDRPHELVTLRGALAPSIVTSWEGPDELVTPRGALAPLIVTSWECRA